MSAPVGDERTILVIDVESTGLDRQHDKIIELGMAKIRYSFGETRITSVEACYSEFEDPKEPLKPEIIEITGITDDMLTGKQFNDDEVEKWLHDADLICAHGAGFDRPLVERRFPAAKDKPWCCSLREIDWNAMGLNSHKLDYLVYRTGYFYNAHRALIDCLAITWLLHVLPEAFVSLLDTARKRTAVVHAFGAPFEIKDTLKENGYRWDNGDNGHSKHWWKEISEERVDEEMALLKEYYRADEMCSIEYRTAFERYKL
ncbi:MAG: DNA polymerase III subunit epsilon [Geobacteraceae bacterium]|nr:DNA polymerase III subunit epsilon [Geobacteraceae bacterium]